MIAANLEPCATCLAFWRDRAPELYAAAVDHLTRRDGDIEAFAAQLYHQAHDVAPPRDTPDPDELPRGGA